MNNQLNNNSEEELGGVSLHAINKRLLKLLRKFTQNLARGKMRINTQRQFNGSNCYWRNNTYKSFLFVRFGIF